MAILKSDLGYYLGKCIFKPLKLIFPPGLSLIITFTVWGFIHDLAIMALKWIFTFVLTPWFFFMGLSVILADCARVDDSTFPWIARAAINLMVISVCLVFAFQVKI